MKTSRLFVALALGSFCAPGLLAQSLTLESIDSNGLPVHGTPSYPDAVSTFCDLSGDGRLFVFDSSATDICGADSNNSVDVYLRDRQNGAVQRISVVPGGGEPSWASYAPVISRDGRFVGYVSVASNLLPLDSDSYQDCYLHDLQTGGLELVSLSSAGVKGDSYSDELALSADARFAVFTSDASNLVAGDTNNHFDIFLRDRALGTTTRVSLGAGGAQTLGGSSFSPQISADGRYVVFVCDATDLIVPDDNASRPDIILADTQTGAIERLNVSTAGAQGLSGNSYSPGLADDANRVVFSSRAWNLVGGDTNNAFDVFLRDRALATTTLVSSGLGSVPGNGDSTECRISGDGRYVVFLSAASNLVSGDNNGAIDVFLHDLQAGATERLDVSDLGVEASGTAWFPRISPDGRYVAFASDANDLVLHPGSLSRDTFVLDRAWSSLPIARYCTAKTSSAGCTPSIAVSGAPRATGLDQFFLVATQVLPAKPGIYFWSRSAAAIPFGGGTLCAQPPVVRTPVQQAGGSGACGGTYSFHFTQSYMSSQNVAPGDTLFGQFWSRDPGFSPPDNIGLTDAASFTVEP